MKDSRLYAKFTLDFADNYKILPLSDKAFRTLVEATLWSRKQMSDGMLARRYAVARWGLDALTELATNDQAKPSLIETDEGWMIRDFAEHQDTREEIEARSARNKRAGQKGGLAKAKRRAKQSASESLSESLPETETETETDTYRTNADDRTYVTRENAQSSTTFSDGYPIPPEPPTEIGTAARPRDPEPSSVHESFVRTILGGAGYPRSTIRQLAVQVAKLSGHHPRDQIEEAIREWDRRPDAKPAWLGSILGDVVKAQRAKPAAPKSKLRAIAELASAAEAAEQHQPARTDQRAITG